jgi:thymidylate synthase
MNNLDKGYQNLLQDILDNGVTKNDRTGTGTLSVFGRQIRHKMSEGFPLLTTKKMAFKTMVTELLWCLRGDTNIKYLIDNGCNIWNGDAYKSYITKMQYHYERGGDVASQHEFLKLIREDDEFAKKWGDLGPIYGQQWRNWTYQNKKNHYVTQGQPTHHNRNVDQIQTLISELKTNPDSRRLMVSAWNVGELDQMVLPPCHYGFQVYTRELSPIEVIDQAKKDGLWEDGSGFDGKEGFGPNSKGELFHEYMSRIQSRFKTRAISLMWNQRSVDTFLGLPFNIASYGLLLSMLADEVNMVPDELIGNLGDVHLYSNHIKQAKEQISRDSFPLPSVQIQDGIFSTLGNDIRLVEYKSQPAIKAPLSN